MKHGDNPHDFFNLESPSANVFKTTCLPTPGGAPGRAFGGSTIATAISAAAATVSSQFRLYSVLGNFLSGASDDRITTCTVKHIRTTRSFATRYVEVSQERDDGEARVCMTVLADFQVPESAAIFEYSEPPTRKYSNVKESLSLKELADRMLKNGVMTQKEWNSSDGWRERWSLVDSRHCPEGVLGQSLRGAVGRKIPTTQDELEMPFKTSADWFRSKKPLDSFSQHCAFMAYILDGPTSWLPLLHDQRPMSEFSAVASLDFALRLFTSDLDCEKWHMREIKSTAAGEGRSFFEGKIWNEEGKLVASMTQQGIARPRPSSPTKL